MAPKNPDTRLKRTVELSGHFIDSLTLSKILDTVDRLGGDFELDEIRIGSSRKDFSYARLTLSAPDEATLEAIRQAIEPHVAQILALAPVSGPDAQAQNKRADAPTPKILMCPPDYFTVAYAINPWMTEGATADPDRTRRQWESLYEALTKQAGADVLLMKPVEGLPDLVFTANAAFVSGNRAVISHFKHAERQGEEPHFERWFSEHGFKTCVMPRGIHFEGAGDALIWQDRVFAGYKTRSDIASHNLLTAETGLPVLSLELVNPRFYHIDVCLCPLSGGYLLYYPGAFDDYGRQVIEANVPAEKRIPVTDDEAAGFLCNAVNVGETVIFNRGEGNASDRVADALKARGFNVIRLDMGEFLKSGGSCKCLTLRVG